MNFAERLKAVRLQKGMKQRELAEKIKSTNTSVSNWEHGVSRPTSSVFYLLAQTLEVNPLELLGDFTNEDIQLLNRISPEKRTYEESMALDYLQRETQEVFEGITAGVQEKLMQNGGDQIVLAFQMLNNGGKALLIDYCIGLLRVPDYVNQEEALGAEKDQVEDLVRIKETLREVDENGERSKKG